MNGPWRVTFDTNPDDCNLHCVMCEGHAHEAPRRTGPPRRMPVALIGSVLGDLVGSGLREVIPSTMGEPLLYDGFEAFLDLCREHGVLLNLTTNGTFPKLGARAWAEKVVPITSDVKVSWNGATAATQEAIMRGSRWERALSNLRALIEVRDAVAAGSAGTPRPLGSGHRCRITLQLTFLETNTLELAAIVRLAGDLGVDRVKGHHVWTHYPSLAALSMRRDAGAIARWNAAVAKAQAVAATNGVILENIHPLTLGAVEDIDPEATCPFLDREAWVAWDGRFHPCCAPDADRRSLGDFGTVHDRSLSEIWCSPEYRHLVAHWREQPLCRRCNMRRREPCGAIPE